MECGGGEIPPTDTNRGWQPEGEADESVSEGVEKEAGLPLSAAKGAFWERLSAGWAGSLAATVPSSALLSWLPSL